MNVSNRNIGNIGKLLQREAIRIILERVQASDLQDKFEDKGDASAVPGVKFEVEEHLNNPYMNRGEVPLAMDIFKPVVAEDVELPVVVTIHGGGLVVGSRAASRQYARVLAGRGYLVFSVEYRLAPRANSAEQLDDVCAGLDLIGRMLVDYNVDFTRMFLTAESAGAYLAIYVAAMRKSKKLRQAIGYDPSRMIFKALGLHSGMFYTTRRDPVGLLLADQFFGEKEMDPDFLQYMNPEHDEILLNLPPVFLSTSRGDFLNNYTLMYHKALKNAGKVSHLVYYGEKELGHAFPALNPLLPQSLDATDRMLAWFEEQAKIAYDATREAIQNK